MNLKNFTRIHEYTCMFSKQKDNRIEGALFEDENGKITVGCLDDLDCTEEHISAIDALLQRMNKKRGTKVDNGILYLTYTIDKETAEKIVQNNFKTVIYSTTKGLDPEVDTYLKSNNIIYKKNPIDYTYPDTWWTEIFYENAYYKVKDRKAPFTIISYNNPTVPTLKNFGVDKMTDDLNWPFFVFVRDSQKDMYEQQLNKYKYVKVVSFPDTLISNAGAVRRASQKWLYQQGYTIAMQGDDDCTELTYSVPDYCGNGFPKAKYVDNTNICKVLAMWQLAMEEAIKRDNVYLSCSMPVGFSWKPDYCMSYDSYLLSRGSFTNIICWNLKGLVEDGIYYRDNPMVGLDDIDMEIRVIESGHNVCNFVWLVNSGDAMSSGQSIDVLQERFKACQDKLRSFHEHLPWVKFRIKRNLDQVCVDFPSVRRWQVEQGYRNTSEYIYDIWNDGDLLK